MNEAAKSRRKEKKKKKKEGISTYNGALYGFYSLMIFFSALLSISSMCGVISSDKCVKS